MTIGDYIKEKFSNWSVNYSDAMIEVELSRLGLSASDSITSETNTDNFFYNIIPDLLSTPKSVSEGGYSISYDKEAMTIFYKVLSKRLGLPNNLSANTITDITNRW
ncbi:hypothetical protein H0S70_07195 [Chryseobacterium manosquense]|uniref:Uncharacterized protein n=1 Tax=Chryseobacterium manosquense TaxID=2754694 RepID=A0A7H1DT83_9FLAO|nr:DUF6706 family protein [Chryseobacterium manosquense]QNS40191.1 hypothetical protein H0S70_07195 [Chryseobacterium manosquense]